MPEPELVVPDVYRVPFDAGQVYLWLRADGLTVIDTGLPGSLPAITQAIQTVGRRASEVREIVVTHFHVDHRGSAADLARSTGARVIAHASDAPVIRGEQPEPLPVVTDSERAMFEMIKARLPKTAPEPVAVDREVADGDAIDGGGLIVHVPGHTPGSIALLVPALGVLFTGDTIASDGTRPMLGPFNLDRAAAIQAIHKQATLTFEVACFGHGQPIVGGADEAVRALAQRL